MKIYYYVEYNYAVLLCCAGSKEEAFKLFSIALYNPITIEDIKEQKDDMVMVCNDGWVNDVRITR